jgi:hypothetical protein
MGLFFDSSDVKLETTAQYGIICTVEAGKVERILPQSLRNLLLYKLWFEICERVVWFCSTIVGDMLCDMEMVVVPCFALWFEITLRARDDAQRSMLAMLGFLLRVDRHTDDGQVSDMWGAGSMV